MKIISRTVSTPIVTGYTNAAPVQTAKLIASRKIAPHTIVLIVGSLGVLLVVDSVDPTVEKKIQMKSRSRLLILERLTRN